jgi:hypothetical protein
MLLGEAMANAMFTHMEYTKNREWAFNTWRSTLHNRDHMDTPHLRLAMMTNNLVQDDANFAAA